MKTFKDLEFKEHHIAKAAKAVIKISPELKESFKEELKAKHAVIDLSNDIRLSVLFGSIFYSNGIDTYECMVLEQEYQPDGYLTEEEVTEYMIEIQKQIMNKEGRK